MIESLEKIVGFMIENCVNLEDNVMYGREDESFSEKNYRDVIVRREIYQIDDSNDG